MQRQFATAAFIIDDDSRLLLLWHKKLQHWLPPGGHVDPDELPEEAAVRETKEETGFDVEIIGDPCEDFYATWSDGSRMLKKPFAMQLENIPEHKASGAAAHQHIDFLFEATLTDKDQTSTHNADESDDMRWFGENDLLKLTNEEIYENVRLGALHVIRKRKNR